MALFSVSTTNFNIDNVFFEKKKDATGPTTRWDVLYLHKDKKTTLSLYADYRGAKEDEGMTITAIKPRGFGVKNSKLSCGIMFNTDLAVEAKFAQICFDVGVKFCSS